MSHILRRKQRKGIEDITKDLVVSLNYEQYERVVEAIDAIDAIVGAIAWLDYDMADEIPVYINKLAYLAQEKMTDVYDVLLEIKEDAIKNLKNQKRGES